MRVTYWTVVAYWPTDLSTYMSILKCGILKILATGSIIGVLGFDSRWELEIFLFTTVSRTALRPHPVLSIGYLGLLPWGKAAGA
jgi:hypothetical protein